MKKDTGLFDQCEGCLENFLDDLRTLVNIDSPTGSVPGITQVQDTVALWLEKLGAKIENIPFPAGGHNTVATFTGSGREKIMMLAHADTVFKLGTAAENPFRINDGKIYGPGVIDCKGGLVLGVYAMRLLQEKQFHNYERITFVINADEEVGSVNSRDLIMKLAKEHDLAIVLEAAKPNHGICIARKGVGSATIEVKGKKTHAARSVQGANALEELANQVVQIRNLSDQEKDTAVCVTVFQAGDVANIIPDYAMARVDIRVSDPNELARIKREGELIANRKIIPETQVTFKLGDSFPAFPKNDRTDALAEKVAAIYREIDITMQTVSSPGASDGNYIHSIGTPVIDGMSFIGMNAHTNKEEGDVSSISKHLYALTRFLMCVTN